MHVSHQNYSFNHTLVEAGSTKLCHMSYIGVKIGEGHAPTPSSWLLIIAFSKRFS